MQPHRRYLSPLFAAVALAVTASVPAAPPPTGGDSPQALAAADAVDAKGRHPVMQPDRRNQEVETLMAELRRLRAMLDQCSPGR